jgi:hypothetical protein
MVEVHRAARQLAGRPSTVRPRARAARGRQQSLKLARR